MSSSYAEQRYKDRNFFRNIFHCELNFHFFVAKLVVLYQIVLFHSIPFQDFFVFLR